jgi:hypothetical protein
MHDEVRPVNGRCLSDQQLRRMWDDACIRKLAVEYSDAVLLRDGTRMASLWAEDVEPADPPDFDYRWARNVSSRWHNSGISMIHVTTHSIAFIDETRASGRVQCIMQMEVPGTGLVGQSVMFDDVYVRRGDGWLFARRSHLLWFSARCTPDPLDQPSAADYPKVLFGVGTLSDHLARISPDLTQVSTSLTRKQGVTI